ncbi:conserved hypothetical protein [Vibrio phage 193E37-1]|nr:conserved hypothetical protein [Vibrio phage 193E37-1]
MKFHLTQPASSDAGKYGGLRNFDWDSNLVVGMYVNDKQNSIYVSGEEFIKHGACPTAFCEGSHRLFMWGSFEVVDS